MLVSGFVLALYGYIYWQGGADLPGALLVSLYSAILAGLTIIVSLILYFITPREKLELSAIVVYGISIVMILTLVAGSGMASSPFIALWMLAALFASIFGKRGLFIIATVASAFIAWKITAQQLDFSTVGSLILLFALPVGVGLLIWGNNQDTETVEDKSFNELKSTLKSVSGQSEIVISSISDGVLALDSRGIITLINPAAQKVLGWVDDALGLDFRSVLKLIDSHDKPVPSHNHPVEIALSGGGETSSDHYSILTLDSGRKVLLSITASPIGSAEGGAIIVFRDITKAKAEEREQAEFISTASHEMRTPVASIEGYLGLALNPATATIDDKARDYILKAHESAKHLGRLFQDLLDVSRADDGRLTNNPVAIDIVKFTHDIAEGLLAQATEKGLQLDFKPQPDLHNRIDDGKKNERENKTMAPIYYIKADSDHLREILGNLIENAIKYTPDGAVTIDIKGEESTVTVSIKDTGIGIPQEDINHLFQKFYRVDNSDTREIGGTGLGLYLTRKLIEAVGGNIWVESVYKQGSTFFVRLPRLDSITAQKELQTQTNKKTDEIKAATPEESPADMNIPETTLPSTPATTAPSQPVLQVQPVPMPQPTLPLTAAPVPTPMPPSVPTLPVVLVAPAPIPESTPAPMNLPVATQPQPQATQPSATELQIIDTPTQAIEPTDRPIPSASTPVSQVVYRPAPQPRVDTSTQPRTSQTRRTAPVQTDLPPLPASQPNYQAQTQPQPPPQITYR